MRCHGAHHLRGRQQPLPPESLLWQRKGGSCSSEDAMPSLEALLHLSMFNV